LPINLASLYCAMLKKDDSFTYLTYGSKRSPQEVEHFLRYLLDGAFHVKNRPTSRPTPVCIWGRHGIGKTQLVQELADKMGCRCAYIAPAQFEEMGDLTGMPKIVEDGRGREISRFIPPEWVPKEEGPGIFLLDDINRADDRILRGILQLLQNYELVSWKLPPKWQIVLTANPDGGDYSVTPMDDAMLTRMLHITMEFDLKSWARWAEQAGVDPRGINFVLTYPELVSGGRTTPRTLVQFFAEIQKIEDLKAEIPLVKMLADACLEPETAAAFISFVQLQLHELISPEDILYTSDFEGVKKILAALVERQVKRMDILSVICSRLVNFLLTHSLALSEKEEINLEKFLLLDLIPNDIRLGIAQDLIASGHASFKKLLAKPELGQLLLEKM